MLTSIPKREFVHTRRTLAGIILGMIAGLITWIALIYLIVR